MAGKIPGFLRGGRLREIGRLLVIAFSLAIALLVYFRLFGTPFVDAVSRWTAASAAGALNALGASVVNTGTVVGSSSFAYDVVAECTAIGPIILFTGAVLAYPATWRSRVVGISMGVVLLTALNLVRLVSLFYIGAYFPNYLPMAHYLVWQAAIIIFAILLWLWWADRLTGRAHG
ncbi:MAG: archaeosortase/exosortase family protein [Dehalococcoidia bacterium]|nr:archaeosortase/exosortase family protein [Dehalococcoidia bacterium]